MKKLILPFLSFVMLTLFFSGCNKSKTYAEMLEEEKKSIQHFISLNGINPISYSQFIANDSVTDVENNEYVLFSENGVYMQIEYEGEGRKAENGDQILVRFLEVYVPTGDTTLTNFGASDLVEELRYVKTDYTYSGTFLPDNSGNYGLMHYMYGSYSGTSVPNGWLLPLDYVKLGRNTSKLARVRLILPAKMGHGEAMYYVSPYYYELTYQLSRY